MVQPTPIDSMNVDPNEEVVLDRKHRSPLQLAIRRFLKNKLAIVRSYRLFHHYLYGRFCTIFNRSRSYRT